MMEKFDPEPSREREEDPVRVLYVGVEASERGRKCRIPSVRGILGAATALLHGLADQVDRLGRTLERLFS